MKTKNSASMAATSKIPLFKFLSLSARVMNEVCHPIMGSLMETSGLTRQSADNHTEVHVYRGGDYPNAGANSLDQCVTAKRCKRSKDGVQEANEDRPNCDSPHAGADSPD
ncbi:hypothetical protein NE237_002547 [Protea cynaroides]|uniref:Uncharacterized protein n=1 Tax=Protea cynaroides TaxID=273540 RepID=A0A9Q0KVG1_9MAGN|nr:hypothetical protein NE237_002547 [Protea cynaroides]